ncbi:MAG TPA: alpha/beta fold hydrolase [Verrucomicrobiae bacterium]|jgi:phospholipase/carboxylesterase
MLQTELIPASQPIEPRLMVVLHGLGDSMEGYRWASRALGLPWLSYLLVNAPDIYYGGFSWYEINGDAGPGVERSRKLLFDLLDKLRGEGCPPEKIVVFGFSQGCLMSFEIGARYPHRLAGLVGVSGYVHEPERLVRELSPQAREQRFLITHGTQDTLIPIDAVREQMDILRKAGLKIEWREFEKAHTIAGAPEVSLVRDFVSKCYV